MPSICRRIRTRLPTYLSTGLGTFVAIVISAARTPFFSWFKHECNRSHAIWRYPQPLPRRGPTKPRTTSGPSKIRAVNLRPKFKPARPTLNVHSEYYSRRGGTHCSSFCFIQGYPSKGETYEEDRLRIRGLG